MAQVLLTAFVALISFSTVAQGAPRLFAAPTAALLSSDFRSRSQQVLLPAGTIITLKNQCPYGIEAFARYQTSPINTYQLAAYTGSQDLNVGSNWVGGITWASPIGSANNGQATQIEFTTGSGGLDYFDISLVNAYNLPVAIRPTGGCTESISCTIPNLQAFCQPPNVYSSSGFCINTAGPGLVPTASTQQFKAACPQAYSYSKDDATSTWVCKTAVTNYQVVYCP